MGEQVRSADGLARLASTHSGLTVFEFICNGKAVATHDAQFIAPDPSRDAAEPQEFPDPQRANRIIAGEIGAPLDAELDVWCSPEQYPRLSALGAELRFLMITSEARVHEVAAPPADAVPAANLPGVWIAAAPDNRRVLFRKGTLTADAYVAAGVPDSARIVYEALKAEMGGKLHALALQTSIPGG